MRYIGNKTKLLRFIGSFLAETGISGGRALDAFAGTAAVGSFLKSLGFRVAACDLMYLSYVFQRAYIVVNSYPTFAALRGDPDYARVLEKREFQRRLNERFSGQGDLFGSGASERRPLEAVLLYLDSYLEPLSSFITASFSSGGGPDTGRMYFTRENAARIDAIRTQLHIWLTDAMISEDEFFVCLAALLEAADAVANTAGIYAAYVKEWQPNALKPLRLDVPPLVVGADQECEAHQGDVVELLPRLGHFDVVYVDPPYNSRQYINYYHVPEVIAEGWFRGDIQLRGKTGLIPDGGRKSAWSASDRCVEALEALIAGLDAVHVVMSYNNEGIIPEAEIERIFRQHGRSGTYRRVARSYQRYRADSDSERRQYKTDEVTEFLYYVRLD